MTIKDRQKKQIEERAQKICGILGISSEEYAELRFETAYEYIKNWKFPERVTKSKTFWNWWSISYSSVDAAFIMKYENGLLNGRNVTDCYFTAQCMNPFTMSDAIYLQMEKEAQNYEKRHTA